jgi:hypothetical protein
MYGPLWRILPGPTWAKLLQVLVLIVAAIAFCFLWLFPRINPYLPFSQNTVDSAATAPAATAPAATVPATTGFAATGPAAVHHFGSIT